MNGIQDESQEPSPNPTDQVLSDSLGLPRVIAETLQLLISDTHIHKWAILDSWKSPGQPVHPRLASINQTIALLRCQECGLPETAALNGSWNLEQITGSAKREAE